MAGRKTKTPPKQPEEVLSPLKDKPAVKRRKAKAAKPLADKAESAPKVMRKARAPKAAKEVAKNATSVAAPVEPVTFQERFCGLAHIMTRAGKTEEDVAVALGVDIETLVLWRIEHWKFDRAFDVSGDGGRPTAYEEKFAEQAKLLAKLGATDLEISQFFGVALRTIHRWKVEHPEFREALEMGKEEADKKVEESLYRRAVGYTFDSEKIVVVDKELQRVETIEHVPPDTKAAMFWLQNRRPGIWRDTKHIKHDVEEDSALGSWLKDISGHAFTPKDQDGPASSDAPRSTAFAPRDDEQDTTDAV